MFNNPVYSQVTGNATSSFNAASAFLWLYSPKMMDTQVIRPYVYHLTGNMVDKLAYNKNFDSALRNGGLFSDADFSQAIRPESNGVMMDMNQFNSMWTFVLLIDCPQQKGAYGLVGSGANIRLMASGWCDRPPVHAPTMHSASPTIDETTELYVTHHTVMRVGDRVGQAGGIPQRYVTESNDIVGSYLDQMTPNNNLIMCAPGDVANSVGDIQIGSDGTPEARVTAEGASAVSALGHNQAALPTRFKSPRHHLQEIAGQLQCAIDTSANNQFATSSEMTGGGLGFDDPVQVAQETFRAGLYTARGSSPMNIGVDVSKPIMIGYLNQLYGAGLRVQPIMQARTSQYDVIPQTEMSAKVIFSSMVASAISTLAISQGIADISFSLCAKRSMSARGGNEVGFQIHYDPRHPQLEPVHLISPDPNPAIAAQQLSTAIMAFKAAVEADIVPLLQHAQGDFELNCRHDMGSDTIVDLHFLDYSRSTEGSGWYEASNRLPVTHNPILGTENTFVHNGTELQLFAAQVAGKHLLFDGAPPPPHGARHDAPIRVNGGSGTTHDDEIIVTRR